MLPNTHAKSSSSLDGVHPTCCHFSLSKSVATVSFSPSCTCVCMHCVPMSVRECVFVCMWRCVRGRIKHTGCYRSIYWMREYVCVWSVGLTCLCNTASAPFVIPPSLSSVEGRGCSNRSFTGGTSPLARAWKYLRKGTLFIAGQGVTLTNAHPSLTLLTTEGGQLVAF